MYGYIYLTTNNINGKMYVGQKVSKRYVSTYYGSGKLLKEAIKEYGKDNFSNKIIDTADSATELADKERFYVEYYKSRYGDECYNMVSGGGGNSIRYLSDSEYEEFREKMTKINKERCSQEDFKQKISKASSTRFSDEIERKKQSERSRKAWSNPELRQKQSEIIREKLSDEKVRKKISDKLKERWSNQENREKMSKTQKEIWTEEKRLEQSEMLKERFKDEEYLEKKREETSNRWKNPEYKKKISDKIREARLKESVNKGAEARKVKIKTILNGEENIFNSRKEFETYCLENFGFTLAPKTYNKLLNHEESFIPYYKKHEPLRGLKIYKL